MIYGNKKIIYAHEDKRIPYYNHAYDRYVRYAFCSECKSKIGEQVKYPEFDDDFCFMNEKDIYIYCPYCGHRFKK